MAADPFRNAWRIWAILVVLIILLPTACVVTMAQDQPQRADGPAAPEDVRCHKGWCLVRQDTMTQILTKLQALDNHARDLRALCGWKEK